MIVGEFAHWRQRLAGPAWETAFSYLTSLDARAPEADTALDGDAIFGRVMAYRTRTPEEGLLESHRRYVDVQTTLEGAEGIEWFPRESLHVKLPYDDARDVELYHRPGAPPARVDVHPGTFCVLFPEDAHLAQQIVGNTPRHIRKAVVKIRVDLIEGTGS